MESVKNVGQKVTSTFTNGLSSEPVLVTGASGFLAAHVLNEFLDHGYSVRGTVRSEETAQKVRKTHAKHGDKLSFAIVKDVAAPGAFDEAVKGVQGVIHTASPFQTSGIEDNERDLLSPAIHGTTEILQAIYKHNPSVKRVVITSSFASCFDASKGLWPEHTYTEKDWNPITYEEAKSTDNAGMAYMGSKTLAEKASWDFVEKHHPNFSISTILPPMIYGPNAHAVSDLDHLNTSSADIYRLINGSEKDVPPTNFFAFVDVRDAALAHRLAYASPAAAGQRFFPTAGSYSYQEICDVVRREFPEVQARTPEGTPGAGSGQETYKVSNEKCRTELGMQFRDIATCMRDTVPTLLELEKSTGKA